MFWMANSRHVTSFKKMDNNFKFKTRHVSIVQQSSSEFTTEDDRWAIETLT